MGGLPWTRCFLLHGGLIAEIRFLRFWVGGAAWKRCCLLHESPIGEIRAWPWRRGETVFCCMIRGIADISALLFLVGEVAWASCYFGAWEPRSPKLAFCFFGGQLLLLHGVPTTEIGALLFDGWVACPSWPYCMGTPLP